MSITPIDLRDVMVFVLGGVLLWQSCNVIERDQHIEDLNMAVDQHGIVVEQVFIPLADACKLHSDQVESLEGTIRQLLTGDY